MPLLTEILGHVLYHVTMFPLNLCFIDQDYPKISYFALFLSITIVLDWF